MFKDRAERRLTVEVRVHWGPDVVAVQHLTPPRSFAIRHPGVESLPRIRVDDAGVSVVVPRGAAGTVRRGTAVVPIPVGIEEITLETGAAVSLTLRGEGAAGPYRSLLAAESRIAVEVALVPAARAPRRSLAPGSARWVLASAATAACVLLAGGWAAATTPARGEDDPVSVEQIRVMAEYLEPEPPEVPEAPPPTLPAMHHPCTAWAGCSFSGLHCFTWSLPDPPEPDLEGVNQVCANRVADGWWSGWGPGQDVALAAVYDAYCGAPLMVPFGLRGVEMLPPSDPFDRRLGELWWAQYALRQRGELLPVIGAPVVEVTPSSGAAPLSERLGWAVHQRGRALRACYASGLAARPDLQGSLTLDLLLGADGGVTSRVTEGRPPTLADAGVARCVQRAVDGMRIAPMHTHPSSASYHLRFRVKSKRR